MVGAKAGNALIESLTMLSRNPGATATAVATISPTSDGYSEIEPTTASLMAAAA